MVAAKPVPVKQPPVDLVSGVGGVQQGGSDALLTIHAMVRQFDVTARALRFYEEKGLIAPLRQGRERLYSRRDLGRLRLVLMGKAVGFSLEDIKEMLDLYDVGDGGVTQLKVARAKFLDQIARLEGQKRDIETAITEIERVLGLVDQHLLQTGAG